MNAFQKKGKRFYALSSKKNVLLLLTKKYNMAHLTSEQRYAIAEMNANGYSIKEICELIGKDKSVLSREFKRNSDGRNG